VGHRHRESAPTAAAATRDLRRRPIGVAARVLAIALALLAALGLIALAIKLAGGPEPRSKWGYVAAVLAFLLSTAQAAPVLAFATRLAKGFWAVPARRATELYYLAGLVTTPLFLLLLFQLPDFHGRPSVWNDWPGSPQLYDAVAIVMLAGLGLAILYLSGRPDARQWHDWGGGRLEGWLASGWRGTTRQWQVLTAGLILLGAFYLMTYAYVQIFVVSDLAMSLVPGWKSAIYPAYHGVSGLQAGVATTLLTLAAFRRWGGLERYLTLAQFWGAAKLLLALSLLFFYFSWDEFVTYWYGRTPEEQTLLELLMFRSYIWLFVPQFLLNFVLPFGLLIWNPIRVSVRGPTAVAALVLIGNFLDRVRIYVAAWSVAGPVGQGLRAEELPALQLPSLLDGLVVVGMLAAVGLLYLLAQRLLPPVSLWEYKQAQLLTVERPYLRTAMAVIAKPH
jgi:molybdopterin-containing oxidoreductase family membrane subunit